MKQLLVCDKNLIESIDMCIKTKDVKKKNFDVIINRIGDSTVANKVFSACVIVNIKDN